MTKVNLGLEGKYFSGRSRAVELVDKSVLTNPSLPLVIDFTGVESTSQSFISEFLLTLKNRGIDLTKIQLTGISDKALEERFNREVQRLSALKAS